jgi:Ubiquitin family
MKLTVKTSKGDLYPVELASENPTALDIKKSLEAAQNIPASSQKLIFLGKLLEDAKPLSEYAIKEGSSVHLVVQGGKKERTESPRQAEPQRQPTSQGAAGGGTGPRIGMGGVGMNGAGGDMNKFMMEQMQKALSDPVKREEMIQNMKNLLNRPEDLDALLSSGMGEAMGMNESNRKFIIDELKKALDVLSEDPRRLNEELSQAYGNAQHSNFPQGAGRGGGGPALFTMPFDKTEAEKKYSEELKSLAAMGYVDVNLNLAALYYADGDLDRAINLIITWTQEEE